jgi:hypothetical protein
MDALLILLNILIFTTALFSTVLAIEKIYAGRWKWVAFATLMGFTIGFALLPGTLIAVLEALPGKLTLSNTATLLLGGIAAGILATGV